MAAYALFLSICDLTHLFFIKSFLFYLISFYRVIYHCSPQPARSSRLRDQGAPAAYRARNGCTHSERPPGEPGGLFCRFWGDSALKLLAEKAGDRLRELALGISGGGVAARGGKQHAAEHVALR